MKGQIMDFSKILEHLNNHHQDNLKDLCKKFGNANTISNVQATKVDFEGITLCYNENKTLKIDFEKKADEKTLKDTIVQLCLSVKSSLDTQAIKEELEEFMHGFKSICIASIAPNGTAVCSYAPLIQTNGKYYIYISEVSEHFSSIHTNPNKIEIMFLQDEKEAPLIILRKRARFKSEATFIPRGEEFDRIYDAFEAQNEHNGPLKTIRKMLDFHLIELHLKTGRFVKGFGQAYDIIDGEIIPLTENNPHTKSPHNH